MAARAGCASSTSDPNPEDPSEVGAFTDFYIHDSYTRGNALSPPRSTTGRGPPWTLSDPSCIREITRFLTGGRFTHNSWLTRDGRYLFTTDERTGMPVEGWDITTPTAPRKVTQFIANLAAIAHNVLIDGDRLLVSHYTEGVDLPTSANPEQPRVIGSYDTLSWRVRRLQRHVGAYIFPASNLVGPATSPRTLRPRLLGPDVCGRSASSAGTWWSVGAAEDDAGSTGCASEARASWLSPCS